ncbi:hypothetical protein SAMN04488134_10688 [Amphibacillus marinus]|uniref:Uncharacterized protein n=1 Tax=Amphibacillus marinus TaxID=872970 RepID=A0A1H8NSC3_9BACI|nr:hypothetical protein [Amphibacillus marinus]SEO32517.1 hypothetical protein SAMN04488134_10688 [Amphibacillus marinus]
MKWLLKAGIIVFVFVLGTQVTSSPMETDPVIYSQKELPIITSAEQLYQVADQPNDTNVNQTTQSTLLFNVAQMIETVGLFLYEGLVKIIAEFVQML